MHNQGTTYFNDYLVSDDLRPISHDRTLTDTIEDSVLILNKYRVDGYLYASVKLRLEDVQRHLVPGTFYSAEELLGTSYWSSLSDIGQRLAMACLEHIAELEDGNLNASHCIGCDDLNFFID